MFLDLRQRYSDLVLILGLLEDERDALSASPTGTRLPGGSSSITIVDPESGKIIARSEYVSRLENSMRVRLEYIAEKIGGEPPEPDMTDEEFGELKDRVGAYLKVVNDL